MKEHVTFVLLSLSYVSQCNIFSIYLSIYPSENFIFFTAKENFIVYLSVDGHLEL